MLTTAGARNALEQFGLEHRYSGSGLTVLVRDANRELGSRGHSEHPVTVERIAPFFGDAQVLDWTLYCETCHVSHHVLLAAPLSQSLEKSESSERLTDVDSPHKRRWTHWPPTPGLMQRLLG